ncbi:MAG TPA: hypothetical protein VN711_02255 [Candidatus Saccharimonadales bacterium]|nr:hypothetical protein [Candidatus Saccharimonadales bacterium]
MSLFPIIQQIVVPTIAAVYMAVSSVFPIHPLSSVQRNTKQTFVQKEVRGFFNQAVSTITGESPSITPTITVSPTPNNVQKILSPQPGVLSHAQTDIAADGKKVHISLVFPTGGGVVTGKISGDCLGALTGNYTKGILSGTGKGTCSIGPVTIPVAVSFSGNLAGKTQAQIVYQLTALNQTYSGKTVVTFTQ